MLGSHRTRATTIPDSPSLLLIASIITTKQILKSVELVPTVRLRRCIFIAHLHGKI